MAAGKSDLEKLPLEKRLVRYQELSEDAFDCAALTADDVERDKLLAMGLGWHSFAIETEETLRRLRGFNRP